MFRYRVTSHGVVLIKSKPLITDALSWQIHNSYCNKDNLAQLVICRMSNFVSIKDFKISCIQIYISYIKYCLYIKYYLGLVHDSMDKVSLALDRLRIGMFVLVPNRWNELRSLIT